MDMGLFEDPRLVRSKVFSLLGSNFDVSDDL
jgi:hypothetical protein